MKRNEIERVEVQLLLEAVYRRYGYDFRSYARASIDRRVRQFLSGQRLGVISDLIPRVIHDEALFSELVQYFSIGVTEMFRDPLVYRALRAKVVPLLRSYPFMKVWHAGCATGEEVYSMAILLEEENLYKRATIYGTDFNDDALARAREGIYPADKVKDYTRNYQQGGGKGSFSEYYHARYKSAVLNPGLSEHITFANHNLVTDTAFGEMHLVFCRNVLIYFNRELQNRVLGVIDQSLIRGGFLCLGNKEDLRFTAVEEGYEVVDADARIYRKKVQE